MKHETRKAMLERRRAASVKGASIRRRRPAAVASAPVVHEDLGPNSPLRGSALVDGAIATILAAIRAHGVKAEPLPTEFVDEVGA